jgi:hypothetical protein
MGHPPSLSSLKEDYRGALASPQVWGEANDKPGVLPFTHPQETSRLATARLREDYVKRNLVSCLVGLSDGGGTLLMQETDSCSSLA